MIFTFFSTFLLAGSLHFSSDFDRTACTQTVETLIRRCVLWRLVWVSSVSQCPTKRTLGLSNPFKPKRMFSSYQLDQPFCVLRVAG